MQEVLGEYATLGFAPKFFEALFAVATEKLTKMIVN